MTFVCPQPDIEEVSSALGKRKVEDTYSRCIT